MLKTTYCRLFTCVNNLKETCNKFFKDYNFVIALLLTITYNSGLNAQTWTEIVKATASDAAASDFYAYDVAIDGEYAIVGARGNDDNGSNSGSAYILKYNIALNTWEEQVKLIPNDAASSEYFGNSVAIKGDLVIVGAFYDVTNNQRNGAAFVFRKSGNTWNQEAKLLASDGVQYDHFGYDVAIDGNTAVIGAMYTDNNGVNSGSAYVFNYNGSSWTQTQKIQPADVSQYKEFGRAVDISGNNILVGAFGDNSYAGAAYIFNNDGNTWTQEAKLTASDASAYDYFSYQSIGIDGDYIVVGAFGNDNSNLGDSGSAYIYHKTNSGWMEESIITAIDAAAGDQFSISVDISGDVVVVGARLDDDKGSNSGSAYVFQRNGTAWSQQSKLLASDGASNDYFGLASAIDGNNIIIGAYANDDNGSSSGSAYIFNNGLSNNTDTTPPTVVVQNLEVSLDTNGAALITAAQVNNGSSDNVSSNLTLSLDNDTFNCANLGSNTVTLTVTDEANNSASATATITVVDNIVPTITLNGDETINILHGTTFTDPGATGADNCSTTTIQITGTVDTNNSGSYTLTYKALDGSNNESTVVSRTVIVNGLPSASNDAIVVTEGTTNNSILVLTNDSFGPDAAANTNSIYIETAPSNGTVNVNLQNNSIEYTPTGNVTTDSFVYGIEDGNGDKTTATVSITINRLPSGSADALSVFEDSSNNILDVLDNDDIDLDGFGSLTIGANTTEGGSISLNSDNEVVYTPVVQFVGEDSFTYTITDGNGDETENITVTINVLAVVPEPVNDTFTLNQDSSNNTLNVLVNDSFGTDGALSFTISGATSTENGTVVLNDNGTTDVTDDFIQFTPKPNYNGSDSFTYTLEDTNGDSATATVTIIVRPIIPVPTDDVATVDKNSTNNSIDVLSNDDFGGNEANVEHPFTFLNGSLNSASNNGALLTISDNNTPNNLLDDVILYTPAADFVGEDTFTYILTDTDGDATSALVTVTVVEGNNDSTSPTAVNDAYTVYSESLSNEFNVLSNDSEGLDGLIDSGLTMTNGTLSSATSNGGIIFVDNKGTNTTTDDVINYVPQTGFVGEDTFDYTITDINGDASTATVTITVEVEIFDVPTAENDAVVLEQDSSDNIIDVLINDAFGSEGRAQNNSFAINVPTITNGASISIVDDKIVYTPATGFSGTDSFNYTITDATAQTSTATVTVMVTPAEFVNDVPVAQNDVITITQNSVRAVIDILPNDSFGNEGPITSHDPVTTDKGWMMQTTSIGALFCINKNDDNSPYGDYYITYTPPTNFTGTDTFNYLITDANGDASTATVTVTVEEDLTLLALIDDSVEVDENSVSNEISIFDNDIIGARVLLRRLIINNLTTSQGGTLVVKNNFSRNPLDYTIEYTPAENFTGIDTFEYSLEDASGVSDPATVTITVIAGDVVNGTPTANNDAVSVFTDSVNNEINVLYNDTAGLDGFIDGGLTMTNGTLNSATANGATISIDNKSTADTSDDIFMYTPATGFEGTDTFSYVITDASGDASIGEVTVTVARVEDVPFAVDDAFTLEQDSTINIDVLSNDSFGTDGAAQSDALSVPSNSDLGGQLSIANDLVVYTPATGFVGVDSFTYTIEDVNGDTDTASVTITLTEIVSDNGLPTATDDTITVNQNSSDNVINVTVNDDFGTDGPNATHPLTFANGSMVNASAKGGSLTIGDNNTPNDLSDDVILYSPSVDFSGEDTFNYRITDASGDAVIATVSITVTGSGAVATPTANNDAVNINALQNSTEIDVLLNDDFGLNGAIDNGLTMTNGTLSSATANGALISVDNKGTNDTSDDVIVYEPAANFVGEDSFNYTITDATGDASTATVTVTVAIPTDVPNAVDDSVTVDQDSSSSIDVLVNDTYGDDGAAQNDALTVGANSDLGGTLSVANNQVLYSPAANFVGVDTFTYTITDNSGDTSSAKVTITVEAIVLQNGTPTAVDDAVTVNRTEAEPNQIIYIHVTANDDFGTDGQNANHPLVLLNGKTDTASNNGMRIKIDDNGTENDPSDDRIAYYSTNDENITSDSFVYTITDANGDASTATVNVTLSAVASKSNTSSNLFDNSFTAYPNPSVGYVKTTVKSETATSAMVYLFDVTGKVILNQTIELKAGINELEFNFNVRNSIMFLKIISPNANFGTKKIVFKK
ncbi:Ig-like domain-containing protein [Polaribacter sp. MED152]|uniref:Ig-like domain-containing protein n=1 Tax=Polaribacter sp. MED152 TaxID=313598 RepID=UPI000068C7F8|nr:Ig-like domain-containing protein [Polaribacter sp. MED152]EAQ41505.3 putative VCBS protein [Polaribacter sp. MED152]